MALKKNAGFQVVNLLRELIRGAIKNLDNLEYMDIVLNGKESLEETLAEISHQEVMRKRNDTKNDEAKTPRKVLSLIRQKETMQKLLCLLAS